MPPLTTGIRYTDFNTSIQLLKAIMAHLIREKMEVKKKKN